MDSLKKIELWHALVLLLACCFVYLPSSAKSYVFEIDRRILLSNGASEIFNKIISAPEVKWGDVAEIDVEELVKSDTLYCIFDDIQVELVAQYSNNISDNYNYVYYESSHQEAQAYASIMNNYVHVDMRLRDKNYRIESIAEDLIAIVRYEPNIQEEPEYTESIREDQINEENDISIETRDSASTPVIRVLFLYTPAALTMMSGYPKETALKAEVYRYINEGNSSFANSNITAHLQLAYLGPTDYDESLHTWEDALNHFCNQSDGYMDEVHTLRTKYSADVCVLMLDKNVGLCGQAKTIKANENTAFCIIRPYYMGCGYRYSTIHEIGHLVGCRHNRSIDSSTSPYLYGHGFMNCNTSGSSLSWCTIMSYESSCSVSCTRLMYWSNPDVYFNGVAMGTATYENNARVWNERASEVSLFKPKPVNVTYGANDNNYQSLYESIEASGIITTNNGYEIQSGQTVDFCAGEAILLNANTHIKVGANFRASVRAGIDTNSYPQFVKDKLNEDENARNENIVDIDKIPTRKILRDGQIYILRGDKTYTLQGIEINQYRIITEQ